MHFHWTYFFSCALALSAHVAYNSWGLLLLFLCLIIIIVVAVVIFVFCFYKRHDIKIFLCMNQYFMSVFCSFLVERKVTEGAFKRTFCCMNTTKVSFIVFFMLKCFFTQFTFYLTRWQYFTIACVLLNLLNYWSCCGCGKKHNFVFF